MDGWMEWWMDLLVNRDIFLASFYDIPEATFKKSPIASLSVSFHISQLYTVIHQKIPEQMKVVQKKAFLDRKEDAIQIFFSRSSFSNLPGFKTIILKNQRNLEKEKGEQDEGLDIPDR